jgi:multiple sugar transport system permease protein
VICIGPFMLMMVSATRSSGQIIGGFSLIPGISFLNNLSVLKDYVMIWRGLLNSIIISVTVTLLTAYFSAFTAFGFEYYNFKGKNFIFVTMIVMMMVPQQLSLIGYFDLSRQLGILDTYYPLIIPAIANLMAIFFVRQYMASTIPFSLIEAARIDGASEIKIFHKLIFPLAKPAAATMAIFAFIASWNDYLRPLILLFSPEKQTLPVMVGALKSAKVAQSNFGAIYVAVAISVVPILIVFAFCSKYIVGQLTAGSVK